MVARKYIALAPSSKDWSNPKPEVWTGSTYRTNESKAGPTPNVAFDFANPRPIPTLGAKTAGIVGGGRVATTPCDLGLIFEGTTDDPGDANAVWAPLDQGELVVPLTPADQVVTRAFVVSVAKWRAIRLKSGRSSGSTNLIEMNAEVTVDNDPLAQ